MTVTIEPTSEPAAFPRPAPKPDSLFGWDQFILLATPFPVMVVAFAAYVLGFDDVTVDRIAGLYIEPAFLLSLSTVFIAPIAAALALLFLIGRHLYLRRWKRLALYGLVLAVLPAMRLVDADYWRFRVQRHKYEAQIARTAPLAPHSARCFLFDQVEDRFYIGGANFSPYDKLVVYVSEDLAGERDPKVEQFSPDSKCPSWQEVRNIRPLGGRYYLADTYHF